MAGLSSPAIDLIEDLRQSNVVVDPAVLDASLRKLGFAIVKLSGSQARTLDRIVTMLVSQLPPRPPRAPRTKKRKLEEEEIGSETESL